MRLTQLSKTKKEFIPVIYDAITCNKVELTP